jgi:signal peptidase I
MKEKIKEFIKKHSGVIEFILIGSFILFFRGSFYNWYKIPTGSMQPTIKIRDHIGVRKLEYGFVLPRGSTQIWNWGAPERGEVVIFRSPDEGELFVKRVVGLPGDHIRFDQGRLVLNGKLVYEERVTVPHDDILNDVEYGDKVILYREKLPGEREYHFIQRQDPSKFDYLALTDAREFRSWKVPEDSYFLLGDNRSFSADSRYWKKTPFLKRNQILGRGDRILYSFRSSKKKLELPRFRKKRFFLPLEKIANESRFQKKKY